MALYKPDCVSNYCVASEAYILNFHYTFSLQFFRLRPIPKLVKTQSKERNPVYGIQHVLYHIVSLVQNNNDAGTQYDGGATQYDAGATQYDTGATPYDAGATQYDAGATPYDAGATQYDAGATQYDTGATQ